MYRGFLSGLMGAAQAGSAAVTKVDAVAVKVAARRNCARELCDDIMEADKPMLLFQVWPNNIAERENFMSLSVSRVFAISLSIM